MEDNNSPFHSIQRFGMKLSELIGWNGSSAPQQLLSLLHQRQLFVFAEERRKRVGCSAGLHSPSTTPNQTFHNSFNALNCDVWWFVDWLLPPFAACSGPHFPSISLPFNWRKVCFPQPQLALPSLKSFHSIQLFKLRLQHCFISFIFSLIQR